MIIPFYFFRFDISLTLNIVTIMTNWNTIHVFGHGQTQITGPEKNGKVANDKLTGIAPLLNYLNSLPEAEGRALAAGDLFALSIYKDAVINLTLNNKRGKRVLRFKLDGRETTLIDQLAEELHSNVAALSREEKALMQGNIKPIIKNALKQK